jgi:hypothetical protein
MKNSRGSTSTTLEPAAPTSGAHGVIIPVDTVFLENMSKRIRTSSR